MRLVALLAVVASAALLMDGSGGGWDARWCAQLESGSEDCGFRTRTRCAQAVQAGAGTCFPMSRVTEATSKARPDEVAAVEAEPKAEVN